MDDSRQQGVLEYATGQQCGPEHTGAVSQGWSNNGGSEAGIKEEWQNCLAPCAVEALHIADATTDDDDIRIEDIDHVGQRRPNSKCKRSIVSLAT